MPRASDATEVTLHVTRNGANERWVRSFAGQPLVTTQWPKEGLLVEALGLVQCVFRVLANEGALVFEQVRATMGFRACSIPLPKFLSPRIEGSVSQNGEEAKVDIRIFAPVLGLLVSYGGVLRVHQLSMTHVPD